MSADVKASKRQQPARALGLALAVVTAAGLDITPALAGSSTHTKTTSGSAAAASQTQQAAPAQSESAPEATGEPAGKTARAEPDAEAPAPAAQESASPIGAGWETETLIRKSEPDEEITDEEALAIIDDINAYFNDLGKMKADFVQTDANNEQKSGDFYFQRPGKVRFDYDRPSRMKIISNGEYLAVENHDLRTSDRYPLESTPFKLLLSEEVNLLRDARILAIDRGEDVLILTMEDKTGESPGKIRLFFRTDPELELASWIITDPQGLDTRVDIANIQRDVELSASLFEFSDIGLPRFNR